MGGEVYIYIDVQTRTCTWNWRPVPTIPLYTRDMLLHDGDTDGRVKRITGKLLQTDPITVLLWYMRKKQAWVANEKRAHQWSSFPSWSKDQNKSITRCSPVDTREDTRNHALGHSNNESVRGEAERNEKKTATRWLGRVLSLFCISLFEVGLFLHHPYTKPLFSIAAASLSHVPDNIHPLEILDGWRTTAPSVSSMEVSEAPSSSCTATPSSPPLHNHGSLNSVKFF